jgi:hypothetical protein
MGDFFHAVELYNSQAMLRGSESQGYVVVSAAKASLLSCEHKAVWKSQHEVRSKMTLVGSIESMQVGGHLLHLIAMFISGGFSIMPQLMLRLPIIFDGWQKSISKQCRKLIVELTACSEVASVLGEWSRMLILIRYCTRYDVEHSD